MKPVAGLYAITPDIGDGKDEAMIYRQVAAVLAGGARVLQYRDKTASAADYRRRAKQFAALCRQHGVLFIVNDDWQAAKAVAADGVHLGETDTAAATARRRWKKNAVIGVSCYGNVAAAEAAAAAGADYVAVGAVFPSATKPAAKHCSLAVIGEIKKRIALPVVAIGGITADNADRVIDAGADAIAVVGGLFATADPAAAVRSLAAKFKKRASAQHFI